MALADDRLQLRVERVFAIVRRLFLAALIVAAGLGAPAGATGQDVVGVLLLRNGQTLEGRVQATDEGYLVFVPGGLIRVKRFEVLALCRDLPEVYRYKLNLIRLDSAQDRLGLAQWCYQVGLHEEAHRELEAAVALDPTHPLIPVLERQLRTAPLAAGGEPGSMQVAAGPSAYELDLMVRGMPPGTVETFAQTIQPLLINRCGAAGCHGQASPSGFRLLRMPPGGPPSRRLTQRNLYATLQWVDRAHPDQSPLVTVPMRPHGTARAPVFGDHQVTQYRQLVDWCRRVAQAQPPVTQASYAQQFDSTRPIPSKTPGRRHLGETATGKGRPEVLSAVAVEEAAGKTGAASHDRTESARGKRRPPSVPKFAPTDPFDPELFNRQFWPEGKPPEGNGVARNDRAGRKPVEDRPATGTGSTSVRQSADHAHDDPPLPAGLPEP